MAVAILSNRSVMFVSPERAAATPRSLFLAFPIFQDVDIDGDAKNCSIADSLEYVISRRGITILPILVSLVYKGVVKVEPDSSDHGLSTPKSTSRLCAKEILGPFADAPEYSYAVRKREHSVTFSMDILKLWSGVDLQIANLAISGRLVVSLP
jgi:hypothetical protein